jgi:hypothetical protein
MPFHRLKAVGFWVTVFSIAMAFMESAVVIYLRELFYPGGFGFPLVTMPTYVATTEVLRELATLIMLLTIGFLAGRNLRQRFAWFIYGFAVWDLFYYLFLKIIIHWPPSLFTWDILFLIPLVWTGPVLAPVLSSITMVFLSVVILYVDRNNGRVIFRWPIWLFIAAGSAMIFLSFIRDFFTHIMKYYSGEALIQGHLISRAFGLYIPVHFNWWLYTAGEVAIICGIILIIAGNRKNLHLDNQNQP